MLLNFVRALLSTVLNHPPLFTSSEYTSFSDPQPGAIGNIAGRGILPVIFEGLNDITNTSTPTKFYGVGISYKPFISLFNMTGIAQEQPDTAGVVNYAAALALEVRKDTVSQRYSLSVLFKNGTDDADFRTMNLTGGQSSVWLDDFQNSLSVGQDSNIAGTLQDQLIPSCFSSLMLSQV